MSSSWNAPSGSSIKSACDTKTSKEMEPIDQLFYSYADKYSGMIEPEGIEQLFSDLKIIDNAGTWLLLFSWKMQAKNKGYFKLDEWRRGLKALGADNMHQLRRELPYLWSEVQRPSRFKDFFSYAFKYCLTMEMQKTIDIETICDLLNLLLRAKYRPQVDALTQYLRIQRDYYVLTMDQWMGFHRFCTEISFPDLSNYNPNEAWPLILDNFVELMQSKKN